MTGEQTPYSPLEQANRDSSTLTPIQRAGISTKSYRKCGNYFLKVAALIALVVAIGVGVAFALKPATMSTTGNDLPIISDTTPSSIPAPSSIPNSYDQTIGKVLSTETSSNRQTDGYISRSYFPSGTRFIYPDTMITMDFRSERLNVWCDSSNRITKTSYG
jgi:hypothetical protein